MWRWKFTRSIPSLRTGYRDRFGTPWHLSEHEALEEGRGVRESAGSWARGIRGIRKRKGAVVVIHVNLSRSRRNFLIKHARLLWRECQEVFGATAGTSPRSFTVCRYPRVETVWHLGELFPLPLLRQIRPKFTGNPNVTIIFNGILSHKWNV